MLEHLESINTSTSTTLHVVYVLKDNGGMQESCHTCCMLEVDNVKDVCQYYTVTMPTAVNALCRNKVPRGRSWEEARMPSCVDCGQSMNGAPIAICPRLKVRGETGASI